MTTSTNGDLDAVRDSRVDAAWRAASREQPPAVLDAAILAAARREAGAGPRSARKQGAMHGRRWWWPLAVAATLGAITVGLLQTAPPDQLGAPTSDSAIINDTRAPVAKSAPELATSMPQSQATPPSGSNQAGEGRAAPRAEAPPTAIAERAPRRADAPRSPVTVAAAPGERKRESAPRDGTTLPEPFPAASPQPRPPASAEATTSAAPAIAGRLAPPVAKMSAGALAEDATEASRSKDRASLPVAEWIALIRRLRGEGNTADAARELAAFRAAHVDHDRLLPPDLRGWRPPGK